MQSDGQRLVGLLMALLMALLVGGIIGWIVKPCPCESTPMAASIKIDTVTKVIEHEPIHIVAKARVVRDTITQKDTVYQVRPFIATIDTVVGRDTASIRYTFPQHEFSLLLKQAADSVRYETRTITLTNYEQRAWWIDALTHVGIGALGYAIGSVR